MNYGVTDALAPFPLHSLVNVMSATINNNTVSFNVQETLPLLLRMVDPEEFAKYDSMTPTALDYLADYSDAVNPIAFNLQASFGQCPNICSRRLQRRTKPKRWTSLRPSTSDLVVLRQ